MSDFNEFVLLSMGLDLVLIVALGFLLAPRMPKLFAILFIFNLLPYFLLLPLGEIPGIAGRGQEPPKFLDVMEVARRPENIIGKNNVPPPRGQIPALLKAFEPPSAEVPSGEPDSVKKILPPLESFPKRYMAALRNEPYALWVFLRFFWTAGAGVVFLQHRRTGAAMAGLQLLPLPFLIYALPYGAIYLLSQPFFAKMGANLEDPSHIWDHLTPYLYTAGAALIGLLVVSASVAVMIVAGHKLAPKRVLIQSYMDPKKFLVILNGNLLPFEVDGTRVIIEGIPFECRNVAVDKDRPNVWLLGSNTRLEFVKRTK